MVGDGVREGQQSKDGILRRVRLEGNIWVSPVCVLHHVQKL